MDGQAYQQVREMMPAAVEWLAIALHAALAVGVPAFFVWLLLRGATRAVRDLPASDWAERARRLFPYRKSVSMVALIAPIGPFYTWWATTGPYGVLNGWTASLISLLAYLAASSQVARAGALSSGPAPGTRATLRSSAFLTLLLFPWLVFGLAMAIFLPDRIEGWVWGALVLGLVSVFLASAGGGFLLGRALGIIQPAGERLTRIARRAAERTGAPLKGVYEADSVHANAFAQTTLRSVVFTRRAVEALDDEELAAICAHEMSHLRESRLIVAARLAALTFFVPLFLWRPLLHAFGWIGLGVAFVFGVVILVLAQRLARRMEERADDLAASDQEQAGTHARALETIYRVNLIPAVMPGRGGVHGHLYDRMLASGVEPGYERPAPPAGRVVQGLAMLVLVLVLLVPSLVPPVLGLVSDDPWWRIAVQAADADTFAQLGSRELAVGRPAEALPFFVVAADADWPDPRFSIRVAALRLGSGDADGAREALLEARHRMGHWGEDEEYTRRIEELERRLE